MSWHRAKATQRNTYKNRIVELQSSDHSYASSDGKALPERPIQRDSGQSELTVVTDDDDDQAVEVGKAAPVGHDSGYGSMRYHASIESAPYIPPRRQSLYSSTFRVEGGRDLGPSNQDCYNAPDRIVDTSIHFQTPMYEEYMPPPLSPRRPLSPKIPIQGPTPGEDSDYVKEGNEQHTSWLNTINESSGSSASSVHSRRSSIGLRRKRIRAASGVTEAEFDAALDAAIETAYDDGFEPDDEADDDVDGINDPQSEVDRPDSLGNIRRNVELAKESVREAEREAAVSRARERERTRLLVTQSQSDTAYDEDEDDNGDEEERLLEEMTRDFVLDEYEYDVQTKSALPRQSDSSGFSGQTWGSLTSNQTSAGTSLSAVAELPSMPSLESQLKENCLPPPLHPPPTGALPPPPASRATNSNTQSNGAPLRPVNLIARTSSPGVRERRLSGIKAKQLKIETDTRPYGPATEAPRTQPAPRPAPMVAPQAVHDVPHSAIDAEESQDPLHSPIIIKEPSPSSTTIPSSRKDSFPLTGSDAGDPGSSTASAITKVTSADSDTLAMSAPTSPARFSSKTTSGLRKNFSSSSLRSKALSAGGADGQDTSPNTSLSSITSAPRTRRIPSPAVPVLPTPLDTTFFPKGQPMGGIYLFDCEIHSPLSPGSPNPLVTNPPLPLEPCPESSLLRPFWFLRAVYHTMANPRGGYLTNRLFVPRDIWRVKNIKLKNVEEKVSTCDLLTAALLKLGKVDTCNADAVLEEMQFLENVMERAKSNLSKKLGNDVGAQGAAASFKGINVVDDSASNSEAIKPVSASNNKSYIKSWRKLRSKHSLGPGQTVGGVTNVSKNDLSQAPAMNSLPMTNSQNPRFPRRDVSQVQCMGPNPSYMGALARLCDAAQILGKSASICSNPLE